MPCCFEAEAGVRAGDEDCLGGEGCGGVREGCELGFQEGCEEGGGTVVC